MFSQAILRSVSRVALLCVMALPALAQDESFVVQDPEGIVEDVESSETRETPDASGKAGDKKENGEADEAIEGKDLPQPEPESVYTNGIVLQGLNKVTARIQKLDGPLGAVMRFGNLEIIPRRCWKSSPEAQPENAALLEVWELKTGEESQRIFLGWMFSSSPGLSSLQHAVYDVSVIACQDRKQTED